MNKTTVEVTVFQLAANDLEARKAAMETRSNCELINGPYDIDINDFGPYDDSLDAFEQEQYEEYMSSAFEKSIGIYQVTTIDQYSKNVLASVNMDVFIPLEDMELVLCYDIMTGDTIDSILSDVFKSFHKTNSAKLLNYSLSVGDVVRINDDLYRCISDNNWIEIVE